MENCVVRKADFFLIIFFIVSIVFLSVTCGGTNQNDDVDNISSVYEDVRMGLVVDMDSVEGKFVRSSIAMALSDFYRVNIGYKTRVSVLCRDSHGDPLHTLFAAMDLLQNENVEALVGGQSLLEAKILAELGEKTKVPVISSFQVPSSLSLTKYKYFIQATHDTSSEAKGIAALFSTFDWKSVVLIYEDDDDWRESIQPLVEHLQQKAIHIEYKAEFSISSNEESIMKQLRKFKALGIRIFVAHISERIANRLFPCTRRLGMMEEGHAWILTARSMNNFQYTNSLAKEAMEGVIGFKSYIPLTEELHNFTLRWKRSLLLEEVTRMSICSIWAHDIARRLARAAEVAKLPGLPINGLLEAIIESTEDKGLSGDIKFINKKIISDKFEIVNMIGRGERNVGLWNSSSFITNRRRRLSSTNILETIIWPGGSSRVPKVRWLKEMKDSKKKRLRVLVPAGNITPPEILEVKTDFTTGVTYATGYCIEVFETSIQPFNYEVEYIPWPGASDYNNYNDLVYAVYSQKDKYDAAVGDITITYNRSLYLDFTLPFSDMGLAVVAAKDKSMWIIFKPMKLGLWLTIVTFFILTGAIVWLIERHDNTDFQGSWFQQIGTLLCFGFSTLVFAQRERLQHNISRFVVIIWIFAVLILTSNYTATLTSMLTVQQIRFSSNENIGFFSATIAANVVYDNPAFRGPRYRGLKKTDDYINALKNGTILYVVDEVPYVKLGLAKNPSDINIVKIESVTNGFGFAFQKGSPLVHKVSREIAKLRTTEKLKAIENWWFHNQVASDTSDDKFEPLTVYTFRGLFMITGVSFAFALTIYLIPWIGDRRQVLLEHFHRYVIHRFARAIHPSPATPNRQNETAVS